MPAGRQGPADVFLLVDGYDLTADVPKTARHVELNPIVKSWGLGKSWKERSPLGVQDAEIEIAGALWDTGTNRSHDALSGSLPTSPQATKRIACYGFAGHETGAEFVGIEGKYQHRFSVIATDEDLQKVDASYQLSGQVDRGLILHPLGAETIDFDTQSTPVDNAASSANGGVAYLQVTALTGISGVIFAVDDSPDDIVYSQLVAFANVTAAPAAERVTVAGTVERYLAASGDLTGVGSVTAMIGFKRN